MAIRTRLTEKLGLEHPIILAPMGIAASGKLAAAVSNAGGLGLVGIGYRGSEWIKEQSDAAANVRVGFGFITWRLARPLGIRASEFASHQEDLHRRRSQ
jgi:nitronate monooxygenase